MKVPKVVSFGSLLFIILVFMSCKNETKSAPEEIETTTMEKTEKKEKLLRHVVIFKFNDDSSAEDIDKLNKSFNALAESISVVKDFEWGLNDSPENFHQGFTHCYLLTFDSEEDRDSIYTPHPEHQAFVASLLPYLEKVFVVDYWANS